MAVMGLRLAARANGVARLHGAVSREMFNGLWPSVPVEEVPIGSITNGVHAHSWISPEIDVLFRRASTACGTAPTTSSWQRAYELHIREAVWLAQAAGRARLVEYVQERMGDNILDPDVLTIGFARRFATYKRATLLLSKPDRLRALLLDPERPVQFVFAGKAHPADHPGKEMIQAIERFAREVDVRHRFVFLPDYDIAVARAMYHGCDVWLNNPRRPQEACGTSGMKAALNGALNCSIRDGWWDEWSDGENGWDIASADDDPDGGRRDQREAMSLFGLLEQEIVPLFYDTGANTTRACPGLDRQGAAQLGEPRSEGHGVAHGARLRDRTVRAGRTRLGSGHQRSTRPAHARWRPGSSVCAQPGPVSRSRHSRPTPRPDEPAKRALCEWWPNSTGSPPTTSPRKSCMDQSIGKATCKHNRRKLNSRSANPAFGLASTSLASPAPTASPLACCRRTHCSPTRSRSVASSGPTNPIGPIGSVLATGEVGLAGTIGEEALDADLAVLGLERLGKEPLLEEQSVGQRLSKAFVDGPLRQRLGDGCPTRNLRREGERARM